MGSVGEAIRAERIRKGFSMSQLADAVGCARTTLLYWESDRTFPLAIFRRRLNEVLGLNLGAKKE